MVIELYVLLIALGLIVMGSAFFTSYKSIAPGIILIIIGGIILIAGCIMIPPSDKEVFCTETMDGDYSHNDGLKTCTIRQDGEYIIYGLVENKFGDIELSKFAVSEESE